MRLVKLATFQMPDADRADISKNAKSLVRGLLQEDVSLQFQFLSAMDNRSTLTLTFIILSVNLVRFREITARQEV